MPDVTVGMDMTVSGWGMTHPMMRSSMSDVLKSLPIKTISNTECQSFLPEKILPTNFCAWGIENRSNPCARDSGGNLF